MTEENQSQDVVTQKVEPVGTEISQPAELIEEQPLGAEVKPQDAEVKEPPKAERTYSQQEWSKRESAKDTEIAQIRSQMAQVSMQAEIYQMQQAEAEAKAKDQREVEEGVITTSEATQREQVRLQQKQQQQVVVQQEKMLRQMSQQTEQYGRVLAAQDFGKEYELTPEQITELLSDKEIKTPGDMKAKAATLALERAQGELKKSKEKPEKFDQGLKGGGETLTDDKKLEKRYPSMFKK